MKRNHFISAVCLIVFAFLLATTLAKPVHAYIDNGDGTVTLEYGDSYGSVAAAYGLNYYNLGYYNGADPDSTVVQPGQTLSLGTASANSYYGGCNDGSYQAYDYSNYGTYDSYDYYYIPGYSTDYIDPYASGAVQTADSSGTTYGSSYVAVGYSGNSGYNASLACSLNNGIKIPAGAVYAASTYLGDGGYGMGFIDSTCLDGNGGTYQAPGGGICGVTTAIHMAGKAAGLTILQANQHNNGDGTTGVSYAAPEDQAMFSAGSSDLVIRNDTGEDLELWVYYDGNGVSATFTN